MLFPKPFVVLTFLISFLSLCSVTHGSGPDSVCLRNALNSTLLEGAVDQNGNPTTNTSQIIGITYDRCIAACGTGPLGFDWPNFSAQFTSWLLPWLALISQLPFGSRDALSNFIAVLLTIGSPTLAAYSLALAVISNRWMVKRFEVITYPNSQLAAQTLGDLQQVSLVLPEEEYIPSLIILPENEVWWRKLARGLDYSAPTWTLAAIVSVLFVVLTDIFTWASILSGPLWQILDAIGGSIPTLLLCFLPILIGFLQLSPKSDCDRIRRAFDHANSSFHVSAVEGGPKPSGPLLISIRTGCRDPIDEDEISSAPIFFYARALKWLRAVRKIADGFDAASQYASSCHTNGIPPGQQQEVVEFCDSKDHIDKYTHGFFNVFLTSAFLAILLQWGTTGAGILAMALTTPIGLGCHSGAYLLYACISTLVWLLCVVSTILSDSYNSSKKRTTTSRVLRGLSIAFRRIAVILATFNTLGLFLVAISQYSNFMNNCWCNSSKLSLHQKAYFLVLYPRDLAVIQRYIWIGGLVVSFLAAGLFLLAINLLRKRPERLYNPSGEWECDRL